MSSGRLDCDIALNGSCVRLVPGSHLEFNGQHVALPNGQDLIHARIALDGSRFAGIGHQDDHCWEWTGTWTRHGLAFGPQAVIYDRHGALHVISAAPAVGYRYVDPSNRLYTCDETRSDPAREIWDYTDLGDLTIGQGGDRLGHGDDPVIALFEGQRKLLQEGRCRFVNAYRDGEAVAFACVREDQAASLLRWLTLDDIRHAPDCGESDGPIPLDQVIPLQGKWIMAWYEQKGPPELLQPPQPLPPGNMEIAVYTANYPPGCVRPRPVIAMMDGYERIAPCYLVRLGSEGRHDAEGLKKLEQLAWDLADQGVQTAVYWDARELPFWPSLPPDTIWEQVAYCGCDEALADFEHFLEARSKEVLARYRYLLICAQTHTTNDSLLAEPSRAIPPVERVLRRRRAEVGERMAGLTVFNNSGRDDPATGEGGLTAPNNQDLRPHWARLFSGVTGLPEVFSHNNGGGSMRVVLHDYDRSCNRSDPHGHGVIFEIEEPPVPCHVTIGLEDGEEPMGFTIWTTRKNGHYFRGIRHKPGVNGHWPVVVKVLDSASLAGLVLGETRSTETVEVTADDYP